MGNLYITGHTWSTNFPIHIFVSAYNQNMHGGGVEDVFILMFNSNDTIIWATYYGGSDDELGTSICTDNSSNLYVTGYAGSNFPLQILDSAYNQTIFGGGYWGDAFILKFSPTSIGIKNISNKVPTKYSLYQNYPNPFNPSTNIRFEIPRTSLVKLIVYDILGREVATLVNDKLGAGSYDVNWYGSGYSSGIYFYKLITDEYTDVKKMVLLK